MQKILFPILLVVCSIEAQTWSGQFLVQDGCDQSQCCCLIEKVTITGPVQSKLLLEAQASGYYCTPQKITEFIDYPEGFTAFYTFLQDILVITLSADSQSITVRSTSLPQCHGRAIRARNNATDSRHIPSGMKWLILLFVFIVTTNRSI